MTKLALLTAFCVAACGGDGGTEVDAPAGTDAATDGAVVDASGEPDAEIGAFTVTSPAFVEGGVIPDVHSCMGANTSPALAWTAGPTGTLGYAVVFTDLDNGLVHSVIYDVSTTPPLGLPADVENEYAPADVPGAHQTRAYDNTTFGYLGPCPGSTHTYRFDVVALDVATLPGATMTTTRAQAVTLIGMHDLATASLSGTFTP